MASLHGVQTPSQHVLNRRVQPRSGRHGPQKFETQPALLAASAVIAGTNAVSMASPTFSSNWIIGYSLTSTLWSSKVTHPHLQNHCSRVSRKTLISRSTRAA
jgi:hypothetical protein